MSGEARLEQAVNAACNLPELEAYEARVRRAAEGVGAHFGVKEASRTPFTQISDWLHPALVAPLLLLSWAFLPDPVAMDEWAPFPLTVPKTTVLSALAVISIIVGAASLAIARSRRERGAPRALVDPLVKEMTLFACFQARHQQKLASLCNLLRDRVDAARLLAHEAERALQHATDAHLERAPRTLDPPTLSPTRLDADQYGALADVYAARLADVSPVQEVAARLDAQIAQARAAADNLLSAARSALSETVPSYRDAMEREDWAEEECALDQRARREPFEALVRTFDRMWNYAADRTIGFGQLGAVAMPNGVVVHMDALQKRRARFDTMLDASALIYGAAPIMTGAAFLIDAALRTGGDLRAMIGLG
ncbi:MAG: hypothetical protein GC189_10060 [Alphaproteobacteria bacterium]|nr:hypothetical protein [Alphaproteobacteria bacterium]